MSILAASANVVMSSCHVPPVLSKPLGKSNLRMVKGLNLELAKLAFTVRRRKNPLLRSTQRLQSSSFICAAALAARCSAEQTQTITRKAPTITHLGAKEKLPDLDDGGAGFPPRDDGGGGGGGGGGGNFSGGFFFFGFLAFLGFLKDKESEDNSQR